VEVAARTPQSVATWLWKDFFEQPFPCWNQRHRRRRRRRLLAHPHSSSVFSSTSTSSSSSSSVEEEGEEEEEAVTNSALSNNGTRQQQRQRQLRRGGSSSGGGVPLPQFLKSKLASGAKVETVTVHHSDLTNALRTDPEVVHVGQCEH
jgi:hypothetical protein